MFVQRRRVGRLVRQSAGLAGLLLVSTMLPPLAATAQAAPAHTGGRLPKPKPIASAGGPDITTPNRIAPDPSAKLNVTAAPAVKWPAAGLSDLDLTTAGRVSTAAGATGSGWVKAANAPVWAGRVDPDIAQRAPAGLTAGAPGKVRVQVLDPATVKAAGRPLLLRVSSLDSAGSVQLRVDYSGFAQAYGGNWASRLHLVALPECALTTPAAPACAGQDVPTVNDSKTSTATATVSLPAATSSRTATSSLPSSSTALASPTGGGLVGGGGTVLALAAGSSSSSGDYTATPLQASSTWAAGGQAGDFTWSYPMRVPPSLGGPAPTVSMEYSAQSVDGITAASNAQPSWIGEGFSFQPGSITRTYKACTDDGVTGVGDQCWGGDNATLSMSGHGGEIIQDATVPNLWHPSSDDGTKVEKLTGAANGDNDGEYWRVTTTDGTQYYFGLNRLPGWSSGKATTGSTLTEPVFGNDAGEPCHQSTFATSYCDQAYQWNLDYIVDTHGNSASYWYAPETNHYARNHTDSAVSSYVRGATLARIDYGTRQDSGVDSEYSAGFAPQRVVLAVQDRCITQGSTCVPDTAHASNWPDVPWDQQCNSSTSCPGLYSPVFFTQKMLSTVTTQIWSGSSYSDVELWTLNHVFKDPQDGYTKILWLNSISHAGKRGMTTSIPDTSFSSTLTTMNNRVDTASLDPIIRFRMASILTDTGAQINVSYTAQECVKGTNMPASPDSNTKRCFPVYWTQPGQTTPTLDWFHKYLVSGVAVVNTSESGTAPDTYTYSYIGNPAWHYDDAEFVPASRKTWGQWRGYQKVRVLHGQSGSTQAQTDTIYFQGMNGDHLSSGGTRTATIPADPDFGGAAINDEPWRRGGMRESIVYNGTGDSAPVVSKTLTDPWEFGPTATRTRNGVTVNAYLTGTRTTTTKTALDGGRGWRTTASTNTFDADAGLSTKVGRIVRTDDQGDTSMTNDDQCTRTTYAENTTNWNVGLPAEVETVGVNCATTPNRAVDVLSDMRTWYDGASTFGTTVSRGDVTRTERLADWNNGSPIYQQQSRVAYDANGRPTDTYDALNAHATTAYTPASGGPVTSTVVTNPLGWTTTTTVDPAWGNPTTIVDINGRRTDLTYDGFGRKTSVWQPGRDKATQTASVTFTYYVHNDGFVSAVVTSTLNTNGTGYNSTYDLFDSLLRERQTQAAAPGGGRILTDTFYDSRGMAYLTDAPYFSAASPGVTLGAPSTVPSSTLTTFDSVGRTTASIFRIDGVEQWRTSTAYGGDHTNVTTPTGGTATSTYVNARGQTTTFRQYHGNTPIGSYDTTTYTYTRAGDKATVVDAAGNTWHYGYDQQRRLTTLDDPDTGHNTRTYDGADQLLSTTDGRGVTLAYSYDTLGRKTGEYSGSVAPANQLAGWTYDALLKGQLGSSARYIGGAGGTAYTNTITGYDAMYHPTGSTATIPASEGLLAGSYTTSTTYNVDGSVASSSLPATGNGTGRLDAETLTYGYTSLGLTSTISGTTSYLTETDYDSLGQRVGIYLSDGGGKTANEIWNYEYGTNRLAEHGVQDPVVGSVYEDVYYTYDNAGNVTSVNNETNQYGAGPDDNQCFRYDYLRRLIDAWTPGSGDCTADPSVAGLAGPAPYWSSWTYDLTGNRLTQTDHASAGNTVRTSSYPTAGAARPHAVSQVVNMPPIGSPTTDTYAYDAAGNTRTRAVAGQPTQTITWDVEGRVGSVSDNTGTTSYVYDADGNRLLAKDPGGTTLFLHDQDIRATATSAVATRYYSSVASRTATGGLRWLSSDPAGTNTVALTANTLTPTNRYVAPFGSPRGTNPSWPTTRGFVNGIIDGTGLTHVGVREYDPGLGRFVSVDPLADAGDPQQLEGYAYANNSPFTFADATGRMLRQLCSIEDCAPSKPFVPNWNFTPKTTTQPPPSVFTTSSLFGGPTNDLTKIINSGQKPPAKGPDGVNPARGPDYMVLEVVLGSPPPSYAPDPGRDPRGALLYTEGTATKPGSKNTTQLQCQGLNLGGPVGGIGEVQECQPTAGTNLKGQGQEQQTIMDRVRPSLEDLYDQLPFGARPNSSVVLGIIETRTGEFYGFVGITAPRQESTSAALRAGWLLTDGPNPTDEQIDSFVSGYTGSVGASRGPLSTAVSTNASGLAMEIGIATPLAPRAFSVSITASFKIQSPVDLYQMAAGNGAW